MPMIMSHTSQIYFIKKFRIRKCFKICGQNLEIATMVSGFQTYFRLGNTFLVHLLNHQKWLINTNKNVKNIYEINKKS